MSLPAVYVDGRWEERPESVDVLDSFDGSVVEKVGLGTPEDAGRAIERARAAFDGWSSTPAEERREILVRLADGLAGRAEEIADMTAREVGSVLSFGRRVQAGLPVLTIRATADAMEEALEETTVGNSRVVGLPVGVATAITPWNYPLYQVTSKLAPALAAGCTSVIKPAQVAPLTAFVLVEELEKAGVPAGVVNVVLGRGRTVGEVLASHDEVDLVSFTGSTSAGARVAELAARGVRRTTLELGGKSASVVTEDADLDTVIPAAAHGFLLNNGQTCAALTRLIVPRTRLDEVEERLVAEVAGWTVGDPRDEASRVGPMVSEGQRASVDGLIQRAVDDGSRAIIGGPGRPEGLPHGNFVRPTIFSDVPSSAEIAQEEVFGPVLVVHAADDDDHAVDIANDSPYGLSGAVWSGDADRGMSLARRMRTGQVAVNGAPFNPAAPFGGFKRSGYGRELGRWGIEEYLELQSVQLP